MDLYIANGTRQIQQFMYRLPEVTQVRVQTIRIGGQIKISAGSLGLTKPEVDSIIEQHRKYGMIPVAEIDSGRNAAPLCYQVDKTISTDKIYKLMKRNQQAQIEAGKQNRKDAAIVMASTLGTNLREEGIQGDLEELEIGLTEEHRRGQGNGEDPIEEKIVVNKSQPNGKPQQPKQRRRAA
jgi:hypothetical protein